MGRVIKSMSKMISTSKTVPPDIPEPVKAIFGIDERWGMVSAARVASEPRRAERAWARQAQYAWNLIVEGRGTLTGPNGSSWDLEPGVAYCHLLDSKGWSVAFNGTDIVIEWYVILDRGTHSRLACLGLFDGPPVLAFRQRAQAEEMMRDFQSALGDLADQPQRLVFRRTLAVTVRFFQRWYEAALAPDESDPMDSLVLRARDWLDAHPLSREPLPLLAKRLGVSYPHLRRGFLARAGTTLNQYRIARRIDEARALLPLRRIAFTADRLGYPDAFTFSRQFKAVTGMAPSEFRRRG